jgi:glycine hydroxymethyltransferase
MHAIAAKAVCFGEALTPDFAAYAAQIVTNSQTLAWKMSEAGFRLVSGGTDNHLALVDLTPLGITGQKAESALEKVGIIANKNAIPFDPKPPRIASGLRLGTPAITSRGFDEPAVEQVAQFIIEALTCVEDEKAQRKIGDKVKELASSFPVPGLDL